MRQVFLRFYLTVVVCFLATSLLIGGIYKQLIERTNQRYLTDIFKIHRLYYRGRAWRFAAVFMA